MTSAGLPQAERPARHAAASASFAKGVIRCSRSGPRPARANPRPGRAPGSRAPLQHSRKSVFGVRSDGLRDHVVERPVGVVEEATNVAGGLPDALLVLDEGDADVVVPVLAEADA